MLPVIKTTLSICKPLRAVVLAAVTVCFLNACGGGSSATAPGAPVGTGAAGAAGTAGPVTLILTTPEPAGANCANAGFRVQTGLDANGDGVLNPSEVNSSAFVCNVVAGGVGLPGTPGAPGAAGINGLMNLTAEPAGINCAGGGTKVDAGADTNRNNLLDATEITTTRYICNAPASPGSILAAVNGMGAGKTMSFVVNGGSPVTVSNNGFTSLASGLAAGSAYTITVGTQPLGQTCTLTGATGTILAGAVATPVANCENNVFAYLANLGSGSVSAYRVNPTTGAFSTEVGTPMPAGTRPESITVDPSGRFAYVANGIDNNVSAYSINPNTGALTAVGAVAAGTEPGSITIDPSGRFAYVANMSSNDISAYRINAASGALTALGSVSTGVFPTSVTVHPNGRFAYVANLDSGGSVSAFSINTVTGALTPAGSAAAGASPRSITVSPSGRFAYVANAGSNDVSTFSIDAMSGALTAVGTSVAAGFEPISVTVDPSGRVAYVANLSSADVSAYTIDATTGALTAAGTAFVGDTPQSITVDPSGRFAYVANFLNYVSAFSINPVTAALTPLAGSPFPAGGNPSSIVVTRMR